MKRCLICGLIASVIIVVIIVTTIFVSCQSVNDKKIEPVSADVSAALITIDKDIIDVIPGDANLDGTVNILDIATIANYLKTQKAMDYDKNNKIDVNDITAILNDLYGK